MFFKHMAAGPLMVNCFILGDEDSKEAIVIDPGGNAKDISNLLVENDLILKNIVNTHGHYDHTGGNSELKSLAGGQILIHRLEDTRGFTPDDHIEEGDLVTFGPHRLDVLDTPGHSPGGISLNLAEGEAVFVGDLLFAGSIGRTDLPGGSFQRLLESVVSKIFPLGDQTRVLPGHGPMTTVSQEKKFNPFLKGAGA